MPDGVGGDLIPELRAVSAPGPAVVVSASRDPAEIARTPERRCRRARQDHAPRRTGRKGAARARGSAPIELARSRSASPGLLDGEPGGSPGLESAGEIGRACEAEILQRGGRQARLIALVRRRG